MRREHGRKMPSWLIGLLVLGLIAFGMVVAFSSLLGLGLKLPWTDTHEYKAVFASAQSIREGSPVRVAGVEVGKVTGIETLSSADADELQAQAGDEAPATTTDTVPEQAAVVTMELQEDALPMRSDARFKVRPRLFLEGNYFVDLEPGSPNADEVDDGHTFPVNQTSNSVQLDTVLTTLQGDVRADLQVFLDQFGNALIKHGGAEGFRELYRTSPPSYKFTSQVNEAFLGTEPGDLGGVIKGLDRVVRGLGRDERTLQDLVTNLRVFSGSFAAEDAALGAAIEELPNTLAAARPAFTNLNSAFPALRAFAREALPGVRSTPETLRRGDAVHRPGARARRQGRAPRPGRRPAADDPPPGEAGADQHPVHAGGPRARELLQRGRDPVVQRHGRAARRDLPARSRGARVRGDRLRPHRDRLREPLGRRQRPVHPRAGRRRHQHGQDPRLRGRPVRVPDRRLGRPDPARSARRDAADRGLGEDQVQARRACETQEPPNLEAGTAPIPFDESSADAAPVDAEALLSELPAPQIEKAARSLGAPKDAAESLGEVGGG